MADDKKWIQEMNMKKGVLRKALKVPEGKDIPKKKLEKASESKNPTMRKRANLAMTLKKMSKKR